MKIYIITIENYEGVDIEGVFSTKQLAQEYVNKELEKKRSKGIDIDNNYYFIGEHLVDDPNIEGW